MKILHVPGEAVSVGTQGRALLENLQKEAGILASVRHPRVVNFLGVCLDPPSVVTEFCSRGSLYDVIQQARQSPSIAETLNWCMRLRMMLDAARGMLYLHSGQPPIIHLDLKSLNMLVDESWRVKICDFNLSKIVIDNQLLSSTGPNKPMWLAPEVLQSPARASMASDVYAFGMVMWEMMTWEVPFENESLYNIGSLVCRGGRPDLSPQAQLPGREFGGLEDYQGLIRRCWSEVPAQRPNFQEIVQELRGMLDQESGRRGVSGSSAAAHADRARSPASKTNTM